MITETKFTPDELGKRCAESITADQFEPLIRQAADNFYERMLETIQNYLCDNAEWNIAQRIKTAERSAQMAWQTSNLMRGEKDLLRGNLANMLATFGNNEALSVEQYHACEAARTALSRGETAPC